MPAAELAQVPPIGSPAFFSDPYHAYRALLDSGARTVRLSLHIVAVTHYRDCLDILRDPRSSARRSTRQWGHLTEEQKCEITALRPNRAVIEMLDYLRDLTWNKRSNPGDDVMSMMVASEEDGDKVSDDELLAQGMLLLVAGHETTRNLIGNGLLMLLRHPEEMGACAASPP